MSETLEELQHTITASLKHCKSLYLNSCQLAEKTPSTFEVILSIAAVPVTPPAFHGCQLYDPGT